MLYAELTAITVAFLDLLQLIVLDASSKSVVDFLRKIQDLFINPCPQRQNKHSLNDQSSLYVIISTISAASVPMSDRNSMSPKGGNKEVYFIKDCFFSNSLKCSRVAHARRSGGGGERELEFGCPVPSSEEAEVPLISYKEKFYVSLANIY